MYLASCEVLFGDQRPAISTGSPEDARRDSAIRVSTRRVDEFDSSEWLT